MKALSIRMPWAYLIARGIKTIENRTWKIGRKSRHGPYSTIHQADFTVTLPERIYIHAGKVFDKKALQDWRLKSKEQGGLIDIQTGVHIAWLVMLWDRGVSGIIGEVDIVKVITESSSPWFEGPYGFCLANATLYKSFIPCPGRLGFFTPELGQDRINLEERIAELESEQ